MKNCFKIIICLLAFCSLSINIYAKEYYSMSSEVSLVKTGEKNIVLSPNEIICFDQGEIYYVNGENVVPIAEASLIDAVKVDSDIYVLTKNEVYKISEGDKIKYLLDSSFIPRGIRILDDRLYIFGSNNNRAACLVLSDKFIPMDLFIYGGKGSSVITELIFDQEAMYLAIYKDAVDNDSSFFNVGHLGDKKSIVVKCRFNGDILDTLYLDEGREDEIISSMCLNKSGLIFLLNSNDIYYLYEVDEDFKVCNYRIIDEDVDLLEHYKSDEIYLALSKEGLVAIDSINYEVIYELENVLSYLVCDGKFVYLIDNSLYTLLEYETKGNEKEIVNFYSSKDNLSFKLESYFFIPDVYLMDTSPYIEPSICGCYHEIYADHHVSGVRVEHEKEILEYTNFVDGGIYPVGKVLKFNGLAYLKGELIFNGKTLNEVGDYDIVLHNANDMVKCYHIMIRDDYYNSDEMINVPSTLEGSPSDIVSVSVETTETVTEILNVVVDGLDYYDYDLVDGKIILEFLVDPLGPYRNYHLDYLEYMSLTGKKMLYLGKDILVKTMSDTPNLSISEEINQDEVCASIEVSDISKTFMYYLINDREVVYKSGKYNVETSHTLKIEMVFNLGGKINKVVVVKGDGFEQINNIDMELYYDSGSLQKTIIHIGKIKDTTALTNFNVGSRNIGSYYDNLDEPKYNIPILKITLGIIIIGGIIIVITLIVKKTHHKDYI